MIIDDASVDYSFFSAPAQDDAVAVSVAEAPEAEPTETAEEAAPVDITVDVDATNDADTPAKRASLRETLLSLGAPTWAVDGLRRRTPSGPDDAAADDDEEKDPGDYLSQLLKRGDKKPEWALEAERAYQRLSEQAGKALTKADEQTQKAMARIGKYIDSEMDKLGSLRLARSDVDARRRGLRFLEPPRESFMEGATRVMRWLGQEADLLGLGFSDHDSESDDEAPPPVSALPTVIDIYQAASFDDDDGEDDYAPLGQSPSEYDGFFAAATASQPPPTPALEVVETPKKDVDDDESGDEARQVATVEEVELSTSSPEAAAPDDAGRPDQATPGKLRSLATPHRRREKGRPPRKKRSGLGDRALSETADRVLQRVLAHCGCSKTLALCGVVCRRWRSKLERDRRGRKLWKWTLRFGAVPASGSVACAGLWLSLADKRRRPLGSALEDAAVDFLDTSGAMGDPENAADGGLMADPRGRAIAESLNLHKAEAARNAAVKPFAELVEQGRAGRHAGAVDVDVARTPLRRLWRGAAPPDEWPPGFREDGTPPAWGDMTKAQLEPFRGVLRDVCLAIAGARPDVGYCQGMDYVAAYCLRGAAFDPRGAHKLLNCFLDDLGLRGLFEPGLPLLKRKCLELRLLLDARCPELSRRLCAQGVVLEMFAASWLQTLFVYVDVLATASLDRAWTVFLFERNWKVVHRVALAMLATLEPHVLAVCERPDMTFSLLAALTSDEADEGHRKRTASDERRRLSKPGEASLDESRAGVRAALGDAGLPGRAMDIKVTTAMLNRIANNLSLPQPLRARDSQRHDTFGVIQ